MSVPHLRFEKLRTGPKSEGKPDFQPRTRDIERLPRTAHYSMQLNSMETFYGSKLITTLVTRHVHTPSRCWKNKERALKVSEKLIFGPRIRTGVGEVTHWGPMRRKGFIDRSVVPKSHAGAKNRPVVVRPRFFTTCG